MELDPAILEAVRRICVALPETVEEIAWTGVRWRVRTKTFAHLLRIADGWPPAYAEAAGGAGPMTALTFRSTIAEIDPQHFTEAPFFRPRWFRDIVGVVVGPDADWDQVGGLLVASYRALAPKKLVAKLPSPLVGEGGARAR